MSMNNVWKLMGGPRETSERPGVKGPAGSKCKRLLRFFVATVCLMLTCFPVGDLPAASAGCRKARVRRYVVERPVVVKKRCGRRYRPVKVRSCYVPYRRRIVRSSRYYAPEYRVVQVRSEPVVVWKETDCGRRLVYRRSNCNKKVVYREPDCNKKIIYRKPDCDEKVVYVNSDFDKRVVYVAPSYETEVVYVESVE